MLVLVFTCTRRTRRTWRPHRSPCSPSSWCPVHDAPGVRAALGMRAALLVLLGARVHDAPGVRAALGMRAALLLLLRVRAVLVLLRLVTGDQSRRSPWLGSRACALPVLRVGAHVLAHVRAALGVRARLQFSGLVPTCAPHSACVRAFSSPGWCPRARRTRCACAPSVLRVGAPVRAALRVRARLQFFGLMPTSPCP